MKSGVVTWRGILLERHMLGRESGELGASFDKGPILEMARFLGATAVLQKPFSSEELLRAVRDILSE